MTSKQQFAKWLARQLTFAAARVAAWGGSTTTMTTTEVDGSSHTQQWKPRARMFMDCGEACEKMGFHQTHLPSCIIWQEKDWAARTGPSFERVNGRPELDDEDTGPADRGLPR